MAAQPPHEGAIRCPGTALGRGGAVPDWGIPEAERRRVDAKTKLRWRQEGDRGQSGSDGLVDAIDAANAEGTARYEPLERRVGIVLLSLHVARRQSHITTPLAPQSVRNCKNYPAG